VSTAVPVLVITRRSLYKIIDIGSFEHLREIQRYPIKDQPRLRVGGNMLVASSGDRGGVVHQLRHHKDDYDKDKNRNE
jgi:hypothetical protein